MLGRLQEMAEVRAFTAFLEKISQKIIPRPRTP